MTEAPDIDHIVALANAALADLPDPFRNLIDGVGLRVEDFPDAETQKEMQLESPFDLLGLYRGVPIGSRDTLATPGDIDMIFLYRRPILDYWCETGEDLQHIVRHVLIHEIGHHFGLSDEDMEAIEEAAEEEGA